jgi:hypothetical protein
MPEVISGFYLNRETGEIDKAASVLGEDRFGVAGSHDQAKGIAALCTLSHILPFSIVIPRLALKNPKLMR